MRKFVKPRLLRTILIGLTLVSVGINVVQFRYTSSIKEHKLVNSVRERLMRLSINRSLLVNSGCTLSRGSLQLVHGTINMDLLRIRPRIRHLGAAYEERYAGILSDLEEFRSECPEAFAEGALVMDDSMRLRYIKLISSGYNPG